MQYTRAGNIGFIFWEKIAFLIFREQDSLSLILRLRRQKTHGLLENDKHTKGAPRSLGENGYLFSGSWGALVIIFTDLGSKPIVLGI